MTITLLSLCCIAYLIGSIPTSIWIGMAFFETDIRNFGSKNAGATNALRILGKHAGLISLIIDVYKGLLASSMVFLLVNPVEDFKILFGLCCLGGHIFPIFAQFKGGKGVSTLLGTLICIDFKIAFILILLFSLVLLITKYVSLSSIIASIALPFLVYLTNGSTLFQIYSIMISLIIISTHKENIKRLIKRHEGKIKFK